MMRLDFLVKASLGWTMDEEHITDRNDLIARLFVLLTVECEKGAALAVDGQERALPFDRHRVIALHLIDTGTAVRTIAEAISALAEEVDITNVR